MTPMQLSAGVRYCVFFHPLPVVGLLPQLLHGTTRLAEGDVYGVVYVTGDGTSVLKAYAMSVRVIPLSRGVEWFHAPPTDA